MLIEMTGCQRKTKRAANLQLRVRFFFHLPEAFMQRDRAMPMNMESVQGYEGDSPILGSEPRPISTKPYDMTDDDHIATIAENEQSAACGPSPFSGDLGYVCLTKEQKSMFGSRGGNRAA
jgi:hypothetical protein